MCSVFYLILSSCGSVSVVERSRRFFFDVVALVSKLWWPFSRCPSHILANSSPTLALLWLQSCPSAEWAWAHSSTQGCFAWIEGRRQLQTRVWKDTAINTVCKQQQHSGENSLFCLISFNQVEKGAKLLNSPNRGLHRMNILSTTAWLVYWFNYE